MKHNFETIKKALQNHFRQQDAVSFSKLKGEIEACEKELRGIKRAVDSFEHNQKFMEGRSITIKEILGVEI